MRGNKGITKGKLTLIIKARITKRRLSHFSPTFSRKQTSAVKSKRHFSLGLPSPSPYQDLPYVSPKPTDGPNPPRIRTKGPQHQSPDPHEIEIISASISFPNPYLTTLPLHATDYSYQPPAFFLGTSGYSGSPKPSKLVSSPLLTTIRPDRLLTAATAVSLKACKLISPSHMNG
ncbi:hypothetical protein PIB30_026485 [Stylosanthes scabra]|uniref:Uncharacterized protein n=1 Tax=Stylosanthes scabra TaxID=79078 RepID=A0ABU6X7Y6_9FABA|nr:hypothetical protein [Stylosanthes scabra]